MTWTKTSPSRRYFDNVQNFPDRVMFYAMCDDILSNLQDKNYGDYFEDFKGDVYQIGIAVEDLKYLNWQDKDGKDNYTTETVNELMQLHLRTAP